MLMQTGWYDSTVLWVLFYYTKRQVVHRIVQPSKKLHRFDFFMSMGYGHNVSIMLRNLQFLKCMMPWRNIEL